MKRLLTLVGSAALLTSLTFSCQHQKDDQRQSKKPSKKPNSSIDPTLEPDGEEPPAPSDETPAVTPPPGEGEPSEPPLSTPSPGQSFQGHATYFDGLGVPTGGCGVATEQVGSPYFVALNVQHSPGEYVAHLPRPIDDRSKLGIWDNGRNCGRWVRVTIGKNCVGGVNNGVPGSEFCAGGRYEDDEVSGATLDLIVTDSCQDGNKWCRDDPYHLDLSTASLTQFKKNGERTRNQQIGWANRKISWTFVDAPNYVGPIKIGFMKDAELQWPAIVVTNLPRGIHKLEYAVPSGWKAARMNSDMGQAFILEEAKPPYRIRIYDAEDKPVSGGRVYQFDFPCSGKCAAVYTPVTFK